ncbi:hypothetical protein ONZ45_g432 [Pleurotus djamor]|nr:hypothetical protein ONZ45_g432 [Pleurotus djamor]
MADPGITDEDLVNGLEQVRLAEGMWERRPFVSPIASAEPSASDGSPSLPRSTSDPSSARTWQLARHALLVCREIIRTERNYLISLQLLVDTSGSSPHIYALVGPLVRASETLVTKMEGNPSALGVAEAFVSSGSALKDAFVNWCANVGDILASPNGSHTKPRRVPGIGNLRAGPLKHRFGAGKKHASSERESPESGSESASYRNLVVIPVQRVSRFVLLFKGLSILTNTK